MFHQIPVALRSGSNFGGSIVLLGTRRRHSGGEETGRADVERMNIIYISTQIVMMTHHDFVCVNILGLSPPDLLSRPRRLIIGSYPIAVKTLSQFWGLEKRCVA